MENTTKNETDLTTFALRNGVIFGLALIIYSTILQITELIFVQIFQYLIYLLMIGIIIYAFSAYKKENKGFMSYSEGLGLGTLIATIGGFIGSIYSVVYMNFIDPQFTTKLKDMMRQQMEEQNPNITEEQLEMIFRFMDYGSSPSIVLIIGVLMYALIGFVISLIVAAIMKKENSTIF